MLISSPPRGCLQLFSRQDKLVRLCAFFAPLQRSRERCGHFASCWGFLDLHTLCGILKPVTYVSFKLLICLIFIRKQISVKILVIAERAGATVVSVSGKKRCIQGFLIQTKHFLRLWLHMKHARGCDTSEISRLSLFIFKKKEGKKSDKGDFHVHF